MRKNSLIKIVGCLIIASMLMGLHFVPVFAAGDTLFGIPHIPITTCRKIN